jgi:hypothetical protein
MFALKVNRFSEREKVFQRLPQNMRCISVIQRKEAGFPNGIEVIGFLNLISCCNIY